MKYSITPVPGGYRASVRVPLKGGREIVVRAVATFNEVRRDLARVGGLGLCYEQAALEGFFGSIGNFVKKLTRNKALRKVVKTVSSVVKHPAFSAAVALVPGVGTGAAIGIQAAVAAEKLLSNATKAPKGSRRRVAARTIIKAAGTVAMREAKQRRAGRPARPARPRWPVRRARPGSRRSVNRRAFRYLVNLQPAA